MRTARKAIALSIVLTSALAAAEFLPLQEGNEWTYAMSNGTEMTTRIVGFANVGVVRCAIVETAIGQQKSQEYVANDSQGLKAYMTHAHGLDFRYDPPLLRLKLPYREGDTWTTTTDQFGVSLTTELQSSGRQRVQTPAGTFDCIKVRSVVNNVPGQPPMVSVAYYAEGMGAVYQTMQMAGQEVTASLTSTNIRLTQKSESPEKARCSACGATLPAGAKFCMECGAKVAPPAPPTNCPKCNAKLPIGAKFCPACGEKIASAATGTVLGPSAEPAGTDRPSLEKYQSPNGRVLLYKPADWIVTEGDMFGQGIYAVSVMEPQENAVVLFLTFAVDKSIKDSVALAARCTGALRAEFPDLEVMNINSTPERQRTIARMSLTAEGEKGLGHGYFFHTERIGTVYLLLAKAKLWERLRPTLTTIAANLAYAPQGIGAVLRQGRRLAAETPVAQSGIVLSPAAMIKQASQRPGRQIPLQPAALQDQSMTLRIPQGWTLRGQKLRFAAVDNAQTGTYGLTSMCHTIIPMDTPVPGVINAPCQPPAQALELVLQFGKLGSGVQVLGELAAEEALPEIAGSIRQMRAQGWHVDARLMHVRFNNTFTGAPMRGLFSIQCNTMPMSPVWQVSIDGSWAPDAEYDEWLPVYLRMAKSAQVNQQWFQREMQGRAITQQQLNRNLQNSIAESNQAFDNYIDSLQDADRSRDYTSHMWSQTTLGQGTWVAQNEGAKISQTDSWGMEGPEGRIDSPAYNTTNFTGQNPWGPGDLELVDTRAEYERYIANPDR